MSKPFNNELASIRPGGESAGHAMAWGSRKNRLSIVLYAVAIGVSLFYPPLGSAIHVALAFLWLMPAR